MNNNDDATIEIAPSVFAPDIPAGPSRVIVNKPEERNESTSLEEMTNYEMDLPRENDNQGKNLISVYT